MSLPDADRYAREQIEHHREQMGEWRRKRAERIAEDYDRGRTVEEIARDLNVSTATIYEVMRAARPAPKKPGRKPRAQRKDLSGPELAREKFEESP